MRQYWSFQSGINNGEGIATVVRPKVTVDEFIGINRRWRRNAAKQYPDVNPVLVLKVPILKG